MSRQLPDIEIKLGEVGIAMLWMHKKDFCTRCKFALQRKFSSEKVYNYAFLEEEEEKI